MAQGFSVMRKWTFAVFIITQLLLYSHFLLVIDYLILKKLMFLEVVFAKHSKLFLDHII